mmetsp:Transcript_27656/g.44136  ORF Transcript_27656/g.44136 Transcript_27656/m.44136 type:complete len:399 (-) Transcript_27656:87-1283(-)
MQKGLATEHGSELLRNALEHLLDGGVVSNEGGRHLQALWWDIADGGLDIVWNPLNEVAAVLVLDVQHLLVDLLRGHTATEHGRCGQVASVTWVRGSHHILGVKHLLSQLGNSKRAVLLGPAGSQWGEANQEEVKTWERNQVHRQLTKVRVQLTREPQAASHTGHDSRHQVVQITKGWGGELQSTEADIIQGLVVNAHHLISVLHKLMDGQGGVVRLNDSVRHLGRWNNGESQHHTVGVLLTDLRNQESAHSRASATAQGVSNLEALQAVAALCLLADDIEDGVDQLGTFGVVTLGPVVTGTGLTEHEVVRTEDLAIWTSTDGVHSSGLQIHQDGTRHIASASGLVVVHIDALQLQVRVSLVGTSWVHAVLIGDNLPKLGTNLVPALASLDVDDFSHFF